MIQTGAACVSANYEAEPLGDQSRVRRRAVSDVVQRIDRQPSFTPARNIPQQAQQLRELRPHLDEVRALLDQAGARLIGDEKSTLALLVRATEHLANAVDLLAASAIVSATQRH